MEKRSKLFNKKAGAVLLKKGGRTIKEFVSDKALRDFFRRTPQMQLDWKLASGDWSVEKTAAIVKKQYGSPTPENPILPMQPPQEQEEDMDAAKKDASGLNYLTPQQMTREFMRPGGEGDKVRSGEAFEEQEPVSEPTKMRRGLGDPAINSRKAGRRGIMGAEETGMPLNQTSQQAMKPNDEKRQRTQVNKELFEVCKGPSDGIPVQAIRDILVNHGFNGEAMDGIYTGRDGKMHEQCGPRTWIVVNWHKLENTGRYEIVAYVS
jgi:hypothetical protein